MTRCDFGRRSGLRQRRSCRPLRDHCHGRCPSPEYQRADSRNWPHLYPLPRFEKAVWLDYDHDNDLDLFLLGRKSVLMRNQGSAGFAKGRRISHSSPARQSTPLSSALCRTRRCTTWSSRMPDATGVLYRDKLAGVYEAVPLKEVPAGSRGPGRRRRGQQRLDRHRIHREPCSASC